MRGILICFEGVDRAGKTTHATELQNEFLSHGIGAEIVRFPCINSPFTGDTITRHTRGMPTCNLMSHWKTAHMIYSLNRWESCSRIMTMLNKGIIIILDQYSYSGVACSSACASVGSLLGHAATAGEVADIKWLIGCEAGLPLPDIVIQLDIPASTAISRAPKPHQTDQASSVLSHIQDTYCRIRYFESVNAKSLQWHVVDATKPIDLVSNR